ncbi:MAG TPA: ABC transporter permease [Gaiellaceae bacterium]|jgi:peptide/nickel transport system permease protein|nr:ABC transporter permease [Gaiellaceae bacterium]
MRSGRRIGGVNARGPWRLGWRRLRRDRWSFAALILLGLIVLACAFGGAIATDLLHHNGVDLYPYASNGNLRAVGPWTHVPDVTHEFIDSTGYIKAPPHGVKTTLFVFGADGPLGRDELIRLLDGGRASLEIGIFAAAFALAIGLVLGSVAGYFGGVVDAVIGRFTETIMAFPLMLFLVFASVHLSSAVRSIGWGWEVPSGAIGEAILIGAFTSFYPTRLVRVQLLTLKHADFVEAAEMVGASHARVLRKHLMPHLVPSLIVWAAIAVATNILLEVGLSFIGVGVQPSVPTWGSLLATTWGTFYAPQVFNSQAYTPWQTIFPTVAILLTVIALNQVSEGVRRALEPWARS